MLPRTHILLIEDNDGDARLIQEHLRESPHARYKLDRVSTLRDGFDFLAMHKPDVILLDLGLPDCHRRETLPRLVHAFPQFPIIVLTVDTDINQGLEALNQGAQDYISKFALNAEPLARTIRHAIERKHLFRRLEEAEHMAALGTWEWNPQTRSFRCSDVFYNILGLSRVDQRMTDFRSYIDLIPTNQRKDLHDAFDKIEQTGGNYNLDHPIQLPDGSRKWVSLKIHTDANAQGKPVRVVGTVQDISDRKRIESLKRENELAAKAAELRQEFLAKTSHEIRTPLNPILVLTDLLMGTDTTQEQREHLVAIKRAGETLLAVVNDILDLAKIEAGKIDFKKDSFSLSRVFNSLGDMMELN
ncbi:MAG: histidine kinase dimerization/phospho-acceptor domain-containing protein, partial [Bacteroidota bacterium]